MCVYLRECKLPPQASHIYLYPSALTPLGDSPGTLRGATICMRSFYFFIPYVLSYPLLLRAAVRVFVYAGLHFRIEWVYLLREKCKVPLSRLGLYTPHLITVSAAVTFIFFLFFSERWRYVGRVHWWIFLERVNVNVAKLSIAMRGLGGDWRRRQLASKDDYF